MTRPINGIVLNAIHVSSVRHTWLAASDERLGLLQYDQRRYEQRNNIIAKATLEVPIAAITWVFAPIARDDGIVRWTGI